MCHVIIKQHNIVGEVDMKHAYNMNMQDFLAYHFNFIQTSPIMKRALFIKRYFYPVILLGLPTLIAPIIKVPYEVLLILFTILAILWVIFYKKVYVNSIVKKSHKLIESGKGKGIIGPHEVQIGEKQISEKTETGVNVYDVVDHVSETDEHYFIYVTSVMAIIIPKSSFETDETQSEFITALNRFRGIVS